MVLILQCFLNKNRKNIIDELDAVTIDPSILEYVILELLALFAEGTDVRGNLNITSGHTASDWFLAAEFTPAEESVTILQTWQDIGDDASLAATLLALGKYGGGAELSSDEATVGWKLTIPLEKKKKV